MLKVSFTDVAMIGFSVALKDYYARVHIERLVAEFALAADKKAWIIQKEKDHESLVKVQV